MTKKKSKKAKWSLRPMNVTETDRKKRERETRNEHANNRYKKREKRNRKKDDAECWNSNTK